MKILHLITWLTTGGIEHWLIDFIRSSSGDGLAMSVCCRRSNAGVLAHQLTDAGYRVDTCAMLPNVCTYERRLCDLIKNTKADLVHNHLGATSLLAVRAANRCRVPVVTTFHSPRFIPQTRMTRLPLIRQCRALYTKQSIRYAIEHSQLVTGVSKGVLDALAPGHEGDSRFRVTYLGVPKRLKTATESESIRATNDWPTDAKLLFKIGRIAREKCPLECVQILKSVQSVVPNAKLVFVGDGPMTEDVKLMAEELGLRRDIALMGYRKDALDLLKQADLLLQPSLYEGFGLAAVEAAMCGVPTVASDVPGLDEAIQNNSTGLLFSVGDTEGMASGAIQLLTQPSMYDAFSTRAMHYANENFAAEKCQKQMIALYHEVLGSSGVFDQSYESMKL